MTDIVERLRLCHNAARVLGGDCLYDVAADEIERLRRELADVMAAGYAGTLRPDAQRYRWLRRRVDTAPARGLYPWSDAAAMDAAIDASMAATDEASDAQP